MARDGKKIEAVREYRKLLLLEPDNIDAHRNYQNLMRDLGDIEIVKKEYRVKLDASPDSALYNYLYGRLMEGAELEKAFKKAVNLDKDFFWAYYGLGIFYKDTKQYDESIKHLETALRLKPEFVDVRYYLGRAAYEMNDIERAIAEWGRVLASKPNHSEAQLGLGLAYKAKGEYPRAVDLLETLARDNYWKADEPLIQCYHVVKEYKKAKAVREQLSKLARTIPAIPDQITIDLVRAKDYILIAREHLRSEYKRIDFEVYFTDKEDKEKSPDIAGRKADKMFYSLQVKDCGRVFLKKEDDPVSGKPVAEEISTYPKMIPLYQRILGDIQEYLDLNVVR